MKPHELNVNDLLEWRSQQKVLYASSVSYASSSREHKKLYLTLSGTIEVHLNNKIVWQGIQAFGAIEAYNKI